MPVLRIAAIETILGKILAPEIAYFSSHGPSSLSPSILKVSILHVSLDLHLISINDYQIWLIDISFTWVIEGSFNVVAMLKIYESVKIMIFMRYRDSLLYI